jgi:hypothetical protein
VRARIEQKVKKKRRKKKKKKERYMSGPLFASPAAPAR